MRLTDRIDIIKHIRVMVGYLNSITPIELYLYCSSLRFKRAFLPKAEENNLRIDRARRVANVMVVDLSTIRPPGHPI